MTSDELRFGLHVKTNRDFSGVPAGTVGEVISTIGSWPESESVAVAWSRYPGDKLIDWFAFDDLEFLDAEAA